MFRTLPGLVAIVGAATVLTASALTTSSGHPPTGSASGLSSITPHSTLFPTTSGPTWSGYVQQRRPGTYTSVSGSWTVPTLKPDADGTAATWVGIDGDNTRNLIQTGTMESNYGGKASYYAWWDLITPDKVSGAHPFTALAIHPGDQITATVWADASTGVWTMAVYDRTTGASASQGIYYFGPGESAEWIQEDVTIDNGVARYYSTAPDWGSVTFTNALVNGGNPYLDPSQALNIVDAHGSHEDSTYPPNATTNGFTIYWLGPGVPYYY